MPHHIKSTKYLNVFKDLIKKWDGSPVVAMCVPYRYYFIVDFCVIIVKSFADTPRVYLYMQAIKI